MEYINKNPKIFIISGKARSGKDEVATIIKECYHDKKCKKLSYAYYLKQYVKKITGWDGNEETKPRDLLQSMGIDFLKEKIDKHFLIKRMCEDIHIYSYFYDVIIITDARLIDEIEMPKTKFPNAISIRVIRKQDNQLTSVQKAHITETGLDNYANFDYTIENNENYDKLVSKVEKVINEVNSYE